MRDQRSRNTLQDGIQVIIPAFSFNCNGRITGFSVGMHRAFYILGNFPEFQVWRPLSPDTNGYSKIGQVQFQTRTSSTYYEYNVLLTGNDRLKFQSGDVIGYYQPNYPSARISNILNENYTSYYSSYDDLNTTSLSSGRYATITYQPLINILTGTYS